MHTVSIGGGKGYDQSESKNFQIHGRMSYIGTLDSKDGKLEVTSMVPR